jgi:hypothetical protein
MFLSQYSIWKTAANLGISILKIECGQ